MKKILLLSAIVLTFTTCKKDKKIAPVTLFDATGTWSLYSWKGDGLDVTADEYPCMSENVLILNTNLSANGSFIGNDTCYVTHNLNTNVLGGLRGPAIGVPGQEPYTNVWHRTGNDIYIGWQRYAITKVNDKLYLTLNDTSVINGVKYITTTVQVKK